MDEKLYVAIDLKSFYASVECMERRLDPLTTNLVVADPSRTEKTICLAVSPSLKSYGIPGRARLFEVVQRVKEVNAQRKSLAQGRTFSHSSYDNNEVQNNVNCELSYIVAPPQMARYMEVSTQIYNIYLRYVSAEDIHVYSVDEVFIDVTNYLHSYKMSARELAMKMIRDVLKDTGITATVGIGTNLYLAKIAMDIVAKHMPADEDGVRIAELDELSYRKTLWDHRPLTDFWRVGRGYAKRLEENGMYTMGDVARCSIGKSDSHFNEDLLYKLFGINAELLIDHAWGWEPCTIAAIKQYKPSTKSVSLGQVLQNPYSFDKAKLIVKEMTDVLVLDMVDKGLVSDQFVLTVGYDVESIKGPNRNAEYKGPITEDVYGRRIPKQAHGTVHVHRKTSSTKLITKAICQLFDEIVDPRLLVRRMYVVADNVISEDMLDENVPEQVSFFVDYKEREKKQEKENLQLKKERQQQKAIIEIKKKFGKNAVLKGMNFEEGATTKERNQQVGGHKA